MGSSEQLSEVPTTPLLTIAEAARVLRIGRSLAYEPANEYLATDGESGIPVIRIGGCLRVPRWALLELALTGQVVRLTDAPTAPEIAYVE